MSYLGGRSENSKLMTCPYNATHQIMKARFQVHLCRCRRNYLNVKKVKCPFNATHLVNEPELNFHVLNCENRKEFEQYKYQMNNPKSPHLDPSLETFERVECAENWDNDNNPTTYNPTEYAENASVVRLLKGSTPSQRKQFRVDEQNRLSALSNSKMAEDPKK